MGRGVFSTSYDTLHCCNKIQNDIQNSWLLKYIGNEFSIKRVNLIQVVHYEYKNTFVVLLNKLNEYHEKHETRRVIRTVGHIVISSNLKTVGANKVVLSYDYLSLSET